MSETESLVAEWAAPLEQLAAGNARFMAAIADSPDPAAAVASLSVADPYAIILGCSDSRVPPEIIFNETVGRLFVIRVASNVAGNSETGTIEYAIARWGCPMLVVLGHSQCGGVAASMDKLPPGAEDAVVPVASIHLGSLLGRIRTNLGSVAGAPSADPWTDAVRVNVRRTIDELTTWSTPIRTKVESGCLRVVGAVYHVETGQVEFLDPPS
jgi:carbonic anhydrase